VLQCAAVRCSALRVSRAMTTLSCEITSIHSARLLQYTATFWILVFYLRHYCLTPVAGLFLWGLGFEKMDKTQGIFKIKENFQVMLEEFKYSRQMGGTHLGSEKRRKFQKS